MLRRSGLQAGARPVPVAEPAIQPDGHDRNYIARHPFGLRQPRGYSPDIRLSTRRYSRRLMYMPPQASRPRLQSQIRKVRWLHQPGEPELHLHWGPRWSSETRFGYNRDDRNRVDGIWNIIDTNKPKLSSAAAGCRESMPWASAPAASTTSSGGLLTRAWIRRFR